MGGNNNRLRFASNKRIPGGGRLALFEKVEHGPVMFNWCLGGPL